MAKKKKNKDIMMTATVAGINRHDDGIGVGFVDAERGQPFVIYFRVADAELGIGDLVTLTIVRSEV